MKKYRCQKCKSFLPEKPNHDLVDQVASEYFEDENGNIREGRQIIIKAEPRWRCMRCGREVCDPWASVLMMGDDRDGEVSL